MPRQSQGPRLYLDRRRNQWVVRDGEGFHRTGCPRDDRAGAEKQLAAYIASKYRPAPSPSPLIADVLLYYATERLPETRAAAKAAHNIKNLNRFWGAKKASDVTAGACKEYAKGRPASAARRDLEVLRAALLYWDQHHIKLAKLPQIVMPPKAERRERWLTPTEAKKLRKAAMDMPHLYRFIVIGLKTGSRAGAILNAKWHWVDFASGLMHRREPGTPANKIKPDPPARMGRSLARILARWKRADEAKGIEWVIHYEGQPVEKLRRSFATACKAAGLKGVSAHTLRHTRATWGMQRGVPPWQLSGHLGMSLRTLESVYGHHSPHHQEEASEF